MATGQPPAPTAAAAADGSPPDWQPWLPPGADSAGPQPTFGYNFDAHFAIPSRLADKSNSLVEAVNDFHYAMINDHPRNEFYKSILEKTVTPDTTVLEIGTGSGLLAMIAAQCGAKWVVAVEANKHMAELAEQNIKANGLSSKIKVVNALSTDVDPTRDMPGKAAVLIFELFGTLLLGEGALDYVNDARKRLLVPGAKILPRYGVQYATLVHAPEIDRITNVASWGGLDLQAINKLKDTATMVFTKQYGFRFSSIPSTVVCTRIPVVEVDFARDVPTSPQRERRFRVKSQFRGTVHAVLMSWEVYSDRKTMEQSKVASPPPIHPVHGVPQEGGSPDPTHLISTEPAFTTSNFPRDMQWGQALQLMEDTQKAQELGVEGPLPLEVEEGEDLDIHCRLSEDGVIMQFTVERVEKPTA